MMQQLVFHKQQIVKATSVQDLDLNLYSNQTSTLTKPLVLTPLRVIDLERDQK